MTVCGAGTGVPKSGFAAAQLVGPAAIGGALSSKAGWQGAAIGAAIGYLQYDLTTFCPSGPAAFPTFTLGDIEALLSPFPLPGYAAAYAKMKDFMDGLFWPIFCECSGGASTIGTPSAYPSGAPQQIPNPAPVVSSSCIVASQISIAQAAGSGPTFRGFGNTDPTKLPTLGKITSVVTASTGNFNVTFELRHQNFYSPIVTAHTDTWTQGVGTTIHYFNVDPLAPSWAIYSTGAAGTGNRNATVDIEYWCGGQAPNSTSQPCCPPDPNTQAVLDRILGLVTLIQRQAAPFSYVYGTQTTGLTGHGSLTTSDLIGVSVDVTTLPDSYGRAVGTPERLFDVGSVTLGTADGYERSRTISSDGTLFIPPSAGLYTTIGYSLAPGVEVSIRELVREP